MIGTSRRYHGSVRTRGRRFATATFAVCCHALTWGCSARPPATHAPVVPVPDATPAPQSTAAIAPAAPPTAPPIVAPGSEPTSGECTLLAAPGEPIATVALTERIDPAHAPRPTNDGERLLFRQLYETLIRMDCQGRAVPGLAESWRLDADGRTWIVTLRANARFSDGTPVTANDVRASWMREDNVDDLRQDVHRVIESVVVVNDQDLAIMFVRPRADAPIALADQDLAIARRIAASPWPLGTRPGWNVDSAQQQRSATSVITLSRDNVLPVRFLVAPGDPRDLLDQDIDLLLTRDPQALEYAATLPQFQSVPLAWQRTRVLLTPGRQRPSPSLSSQARQVLAGDAVRGEARGAQEPFWWQTVQACEVSPPPARSPASFSSRIVYDANDGAGRDLAERLVGLVRGSGPDAKTFLDVFLPDRPHRTYQRAVGLTGDALAVALRRGGDAAYVLSVDAHPVEPCRDLQALTDAAPWLDPETIVALVDTRLQAIIRRGRSGATVDWDVGLRIAGVNTPR